MGDSGIELIEQWLQASPFVGQLGITVDKLDDGLAVLTLPFRQEHTTRHEVGKPCFDAPPIGEIVDP